MASINFKSNIEKVAKDITDRTKKFGDQTVPYKKASIYLDRWVQGNFKEEGGKVGWWVPLAAGGRWIKWKGLDTSAKILQNTGTLRGSFHAWATKKDAGIKSQLPYAADHEHGKRNLPVRRMLPKRSEVIGDIREIFKQHGNKELRGSKRV